ncbi:MAG TPA: sigma-54 dependent transcriptional regulator, partial [Candidatus Krumholzibacteria bacterium]|nr:sigma-54 dependent transcriptional regulator [Candidatus Krumholzibacteria bacterium]
AVHRHGPRSAAPFVAVNCSAIPDALLESELFGHERGAFTGAVKRKPGRFELAEGGTLFLDEIGDVSLEMQVKLLRVLQEREYERLGGTETLKADLRILAATHQNLQQLIKEGRFREDLYYRLAVIPIEIPPLRERREDIPLLVAHFVQQLSEKNKSPTPSVLPEVLDRLNSYDWPGNVRELENVIERAVVLCKDRVILPQNLPAHIAPRRFEGNVLKVPMGTPMREIQEQVIDQTLAITNGNKEKAAKILGVAARTIYRHMKAREEQPANPSGDDPSAK